MCFSLLMQIDPSVPGKSAKKRVGIGVEVLRKKNHANPGTKRSS